LLRVKKTIATIQNLHQFRYSSRFNALVFYNVELSIRTSNEKGEIIIYEQQVVAGIIHIGDVFF